MRQFVLQGHYSDPVVDKMIIARRHAMARNPWVGAGVSLRRQKVISGG